MRRRRLVSAEEEARWEWNELSEEEEETETREEGDWLGERGARRGRAKLQVERDRGVDVTERMVRRLGFDWQGVVWGPQGGARRSLSLSLSLSPLLFPAVGLCVALCMSTCGIALPLGCTCALSLSLSQVLCSICCLMHTMVS